MKSLKRISKIQTKIKTVLTQMLSVGVVAIIGLFLIEAPASAFSGSGAGTPASPYQITNATQLQEMQDDLAAHYVLMNDIDCSDTVDWNGGAGFAPIHDFTGTLDGQGHIITALFINSFIEHVGLFGYTGGSTEIKNVGLVDVDITGVYIVGGLVGYNYYGTITNSYATGNVSGWFCVGGLVGYNYYGTITNSYATGSITGTGDWYAGGLVGGNHGSITNSYSTGSVTGQCFVAGGLVSWNDGHVINSYSTGSVTGQCYVAGGLVGRNHGSITNSYSTGSVTGQCSVAGGLVGRNHGSITNSYSTGSVTGKVYVGGLVGRNLSETITSCYWNNHAGNPSVGIGYGPGDCTAINNNESYFYFSSNPPMDLWDFVNVWGIDEGVSYPYLLLQIADTTPPQVEITFPTAGLALQDIVTLTAVADDLSGVSDVYFYVREPDGGDGIPIGCEDLPAAWNGTTELWEFDFDTTGLLDGYYVILAKAVDTQDNEGWSEVVPFSIRNWAVVELLPASESSKSGRTMPVKFSLMIAETVDPEMPFVYNEELKIIVYDAADPGTILQTSLYGDTSRDYRIDSVAELYITNFKTKKRPAEYVVEIWRASENFLIGSFTFETVR